MSERFEALSWSRLFSARQSILAMALTLASGCAAWAQTPAPCDGLGNLGATTQLQVTQQAGRALVEIARPNSVGRKVEIEYGDELYSVKFGPDGRVRLGFALTAANNQFTINMSETPPVTCALAVPNFNKLFRVVLRWRDPVQLDLTPVATMASIPTVLILSTAKGHKTLAGLVAAAKAKPGDIVGTTAGIGSATHMNLERFRISAGIEVLRLHMKGAPEALTEVLTGRSDFYFALPFQVASNLKDGKIVAVAVGSPKRSALFPDLPTTVEAGFPNSDYNFWVGALMATRTPRDIVLRLNREINAAMAASDVRARTLKLGADPLSMSLPDFEAMIREEFESNARLIKAAGIEAN